MESENMKKGRKNLFSGGGGRRGVDGNIGRPQPLGGKNYEEKIKRENL
jgi:hypothetical protein